MIRLIDVLEQERKILNELGEQSIKEGIPLAKNEAVQAQSRIVDQLVIRLQNKRKTKYEKRRSES